MEHGVKRDEDYAAQIASFATRQRRDPDHSDQSRVTEALIRCLEAQHLPGYVSHFQTQKSDQGWGCGFRNIQMIASFLLVRDKESEEALFAGCGFVPDLLTLQGWLERAWKAGIDTAGGDLLGNIAQGTQQWIGTTECAALLRFFGFKAEIVDFTGGLKHPNVTTDEDGNDVHMGVECDHCHQCPILGPRFNSQVVDDYDLCMNCHSLPESKSLAPFRIIEMLRGPHEKGGSKQKLKARPHRSGRSVKDLFANHLNKNGSTDGLQAAFHDKSGLANEALGLIHDKAGTYQGLSAVLHHKAGMLRGPDATPPAHAGTSNSPHAASHAKAGTVQDPHRTAHDKAGTTKDPVLADKLQHEVAPHSLLMHWCWDYFRKGSALQKSSVSGKQDTSSKGREAGPSSNGHAQHRAAKAAKLLPQQRSSQAQTRVFRSGRSPLYFQHHGHSRTIIGIERFQRAGQSQHEYNLLVLDPSIKSKDIEARLKSGKGWQRLLKQGVEGLAKAQYQLLYVQPGLMQSNEKADWDIMTAIETF